jgi:cytochrome c551/c552
MRSYEGGRMVCIVPDFDFVTNDTVYNALLKELEEPNPGKLFLLTAQRPDRILPTIRSRTASLRFDALTEAEIAQALASQHGVEAVRARSLAKRVQGSLGDAVAALAEDGAALYESSRDWALACLSSPRRIPTPPALSKDTARTDVVEVLRGARSAVRDALALSIADAGLILDSPMLATYRSLLEALGAQAPSRLIDALGAINEAARIADETNIPPTIVLGWLQVQLRSV